VVENGVVLGGVRRIGTSKFTAEILEKSHLERDLTNRPWVDQPEVHRCHRQGPVVQSLRGGGLSRSGIAHSDMRFVTTGDRVRLYDPELAAVAREVVQAPAAIEIRFI
jgi:diketogulonate reductase-like aldo/keto reductase